MKSSFTRRSFLKTSALAGTALSSLVSVPNILSAPNPGSKLNCGIIGCGGRMMNHLDWLLNNSKDNVVAAVDPDEKQHDKIKSYLAKHEGNPERLKVFTDYRQMFDKMGKGLDLVVVATPNHHHAPASMHAMHRDIAVY